MAHFTLYADSRSGNCYKVKWSADYLGLAHEWVETDILAQKTRTPEFLALNNFGQVPTAVFYGETGEATLTIAQSNAIVLYLGEIKGHEHFYPRNPEQRAKIHEWLFWEQNSHEPYIAGRRYRKNILGHSDEQIDQEWLPRGHVALAKMASALEVTAFLTGDHMSAADVVLLGYTRCAHEGGFDLSQYPAIETWIERTQTQLNIAPYSETA